MRIKSIQQFRDPFPVNCYFPHGGEWTSPFWGRVRICLTSEGRLELPVTNISFFLSMSATELSVVCDCGYFLIILTYYFRIPFSLSDVIRNTSFCSYLTNDQNFSIFPLLFYPERRSCSQTWRYWKRVPKCTNCAPFVAGFFLLCYERDFMLSLSNNNQSDIIEASNSTSRYLDDLLDIDNPYFEQMVG